MIRNPALHNPDLNSGAFFWEAGSVGVFLSHGLTATSAEVRPLAHRLHNAVSWPKMPSAQGSTGQPD